MQISRIDRLAGKQALCVRGAFHPQADDRVPDMPAGGPARTLVLIGNVGAELWPGFGRAPEFADGRPDPLNRWSARVIGRLAAALGAAALYPFGGPPYQPFVAWAKRAEPVRESPLGMLIHPDYGLWHAYRGALAFAERLELPAPDARPRPCDSCADKPCLTACPVGAFSARGGDVAGYDVAGCVAHVAAAAGADCLALGCRARRACPVGRAYHYEAAQAHFHMAAFLDAQLAEAPR